MAKLDTAGTYRGEIVEAGLGVTKNGFPQFVGRFKATEKFVEELSELQHFHEQGVVEARDEEGKTFDPQWVDWSAFDEYITGFLVLFNNDEEFSEDTKLMNYDQLQTALGWGGTEFESLNDDTHVGKTVLFRVEEDEYNGQTQLKVNWIDDPEASPTRELRKLDDDKLKGLQSKLKMGGKKQAAKSAKAAKPAGKPSGGKQTKTSSDDSGGGSDTPTSKSNSGPPKKSPPKKDPEPEQQEEQQQEEEEQTESSESTSLPSAISQDTAWEFVCENKGDNSDSDVEDAWIAACNEVGEDKDEDDFTEEEWAKVRDIVIRDLALDV